MADRLQLKSLDQVFKECNPDGQTPDWAAANCSDVIRAIFQGTNDECIDLEVLEHSKLLQGGNLLWQSAVKKGHAL